MKHMSDNDLAYLAGLFDGEGSASISKKKINLNHAYGLAISITNTDLEVLKWVLISTGLGKITAKPRNVKHWKLCYQWTLMTNEIKSFLLALRPFLKIKKQKADFMLEFLEMQAYHGPHYPIPESVVMMREIIFQELAELNKRGSV